LRPCARSTPTHEDADGSGRAAVWDAAHRPAAESTKVDFV
jgi:hypothetical protein